MNAFTSLMLTVMMVMMSATVAVSSLPGQETESVASLALERSLAEDEPKECVDACRRFLLFRGRFLHRHAELADGKEGPCSQRCAFTSRVKSLQGDGWECGPCEEE